ncbi:hypothetical protein [Escherichia coli]|uniref:hypothetical protein n=1 Tax=Escherichia coli TaxID=562 RepID=UPI0018666BFF|nr:hypothetical protein [Escherichia coli]HCJ9453890.1 hypothetical protein [Escherichia coli]
MKKISKTSNLLSLIYSMLSTISVYLLSFILADKSKVLFGEFSSFIFLLNIFVSSAGVGIDIQTIRLFIKDKTAQINTYFFIGCILNLWLALLYIIISISLNNLLYIIAFPVVISQFFITYIAGRLQSEKKYLEMSFTFNSINILRLLFMIVILYFEKYPDLKLIIISFTVIHSAFTFYIIYKNRVFFKLTSFNSYIRLTNKNKVYSLGILAIAPFLHMLIYQSDIVILSIYFEPTIIASYSIVVTILTAIYYFPSLIANRYLLSYLLDIGYKRKKNKAKLFHYYNLSCFVLVIFLYFLSKTIFSILFSGKYIESYEIFQLLLIACLFRLLSIPIATSLNTDVLAPKKISIMAFIAIINIIFNFIFVPRYGINFLILSTILTEILLFTSYLTLLKKHEKLHFRSSL